MPGPSTIIVGGGLSGLCVAHALIAEGSSVTVFERDPSRDARGQGYRLTIDATGSESLQACLPSRNYDFIRATAGAADKTGAFVFMDERARELHRITFDLEAGEQRGHITGQVDRHTLRQALLSPRSVAIVITASMRRNAAITSCRPCQPAASPPIGATARCARIEPAIRAPRLISPAITSLAPRKRMARLSKPAMLPAAARAMLLRLAERNPVQAALSAR